VHFEHDLRIADVQLVVALVDEDALRIEHRPHRSVEEVDMLVCDCLDEVHVCPGKKKPRQKAGRLEIEFTAGSLAFF
jgi:hypothetical protein